MHYEEPPGPHYIDWDTVVIAILTLAVAAYFIAEWWVT